MTHVSVVVAFAFLTIVPSARTQDCQSWSGGLRLNARLAYDYTPKADIGIKGTVAYAVKDRVAIIDIEDPSNPQPYGEIASVWQPWRLDMAGDLLAVALGDYGIEFYSTVDPWAPTLVHYLPSAYRTLDVCVVGNACYRGSSIGLCSIDVSDPAAPVEHAPIDGSSTYWRVSHQDGFLFCATNDGLVIYDLDDPMAPEERFRWSDSGSYVSAVPMDDLLCLARGNDGFALFDITDPGSPVLLGEMGDVGAALTSQRSGDLLYLATHFNPYSLRAFDISGSAPWPLIDTVISASRPGAIALIDDIIYLASQDFFDAIDISVPANDAEVIGFDDHPYYNSRFDVVVGGGYAYATSDGPEFDGDEYVEIIDVGDPTTPHLVQTLNFSGGMPSALVHAGDYLYVADSGIDVVDLTDPPNASVVGHLQTPYGPSGLAMAGDHLYITSYYHGILIASIADDPTQPVLVGAIDPVNIVGAIQTAGGLAYVIANWDGLLILDLAIPDAPTVIGELSGLGGAASSIAISGSTVYIDGDSELHVIDVSDPSDPILVDTVEIPNPISELLVVGDVLYVSAQGVHALDIRDPRQPEYIGDLDLEGLSAGLGAAGDFLCVASGGRLNVLPLDCLSVTGVSNLPETLPATMLAAYPNPFNPTVNLDFDLPVAGHIRLEIFDVAGRRLRTLLDDRFAAGPHTLSWDGRDDRGRSLPSGVYLIDLRSAAFHARTKLALLR